MDTGRQRELDLRIVHLFNDSTFCLAGGHGFNSDDLNRMGSGTVTSSHIAIALCNCSRYSQITVFSVHVVSTRTRIVAQPYSKILDFQWFLFPDFFNRDNFASGFLEFPQLTKEIPEAEKMLNFVIELLSKALVYWLGAMLDTGIYRVRTLNCHPL